MAEYPPPTEDLPIFNTIVFREAKETDFPVVKPTEDTVGTIYPTFVDGTDGRKQLLVDTDVTYSLNTNTLNLNQLQLTSNTTALDSLIIRASTDSAIAITSATVQTGTGTGTVCSFADMYL